MNGDLVKISYLRLMVSWGILNRLLTEPLLPKGAYALQRNVTALIPHFKKLYSKQGDLIRKYGKLDEEKQEYIADKDNPELIAEYEIFKDKEFEVVLMPIEMKNLIAPITAQELDAIGYMLCEDKILVDSPFILQ